MEAVGALVGPKDGMVAGHGGVLAVADVLALLARVPVSPDGPGMIDQLRKLEDVKALAAARQADIAVAFDAAQRREQAAAGVPAEEQGTGVGAQIALARRESPRPGRQAVGDGEGPVRDAADVDGVPVRAVE